MIRRLFLRLSLYFSPPKVGDVYLGDSFMFMAPHIIVEKILHKCIDKTGESVWEPVYGEGAYKLWIESDTMPYYRCKGELLATYRTDGSKHWIERRTKRRLDKKVFIQMILDGELKKHELI